MKKKNLILIGMPGCGKTRLSQVLGAVLGMEAVDTDELVERAAGRSIPEIFASRGEAAFREMEAAAVRQAAAMDGVIVATGGGAVLREENRQALREGGMVFFRDRDVAAILEEDHSGRPLIGGDRERVWRLFEERYPLYRDCAHCIVRNTRTVEQAAAVIAQAYLKECQQ